MKFLLLILLGSCALFKVDKDVPLKIKQHNLAGKWVNDFGSFKIWCQGQFEYHEPMTWNNMEPKNSEKGGHIVRFKTNEFKTGPVFGETHTINQWPYKNEKDQWWMVMDNKDWNRVEVYECKD